MAIGARLSWDDGSYEATTIPGREDTYLVGRVREIGRLRRRVRVGAPDPSLTPVSGLVAVTELVDRLGMITLVNSAIGLAKARDGGFTGEQLSAYEHTCRSAYEVICR
ncbi:MAG: hypothetical protein M3R63_05720 [Actinomycetota bacterium]|nr:hypothetical protein [Actinomycetota bacterium]